MRTEVITALVLIVAIIFAGCVSQTDTGDQDSGADIGEPSEKPVSADTDTEQIQTTPSETPVSEKVSLNKIATLKGHDTTIKVVSISPDGKFIATGSKDKTVKIWDAQTGALINTLPHSLSIEAIGWSPSGDRILTATGDLFGNGEAYLWDAGSGEKLQTLKNPGISSLSWSSKNPFVWSPQEIQWFAAGGGVYLHIWEIGKTSPTFKWESHTTGITSVAWSPSGILLATSSLDKTAIIWNTAAGTPKHTLRHPSYVELLVWSPNNKKIATVADDNIVRVWDTETGTLEKELPHAGTRVRTIGWSPDSKKLATGADYLQIWDVASGELLDETNYEGIVSAIHWAKEGMKITANSFFDVNVYGP